MEQKWIKTISSKRKIVWTPVALRYLQYAVLITESNCPNMKAIRVFFSYQRSMCRFLCCGKCAYRRYDKVVSTQTAMSDLWQMLYCLPIDIDPRIIVFFRLLNPPVANIILKYDICPSCDKSSDARAVADGHSCIAWKMWLCRVVANVLLT